MVKFSKLRKYTFLQFLDIHIVLTVASEFKMKRQSNRNSLTIMFLIVLCIFALKWIKFSKIDSIHWRKVYFKGEIENIPNITTAYTRESNTKQGFQNRKQLLKNTNLDTKKEPNKYRLMIDELLAARSSKINIEEEMDKLNRERVAADDQRLIKIIRNHFINPPSNLPYNLRDMNKLDTSMGQAAFVDNRLGFKENGFFVETGAHDGEFISNTLFLERTRHWTGVLIEPLPASFRALQQKHRQAYTINACLSLYPYPSMEYLTTDPVVGKIVQGNQIPQKYGRNTKVRVQCFPLYSILLAFNQTNVDFLSLDVEGVERQVLDAIPWNKVDINIVSVEYDKWPGGTDMLCKYMKSKGYDCSVKIEAEAAADMLFRKKYS